MRRLLLVCAMLSLAGCSKEAIYDSFRADARNQCAKGPSSSYHECIERSSKSYKEYERERQEHMQSR